MVRPLERATTPERPASDNDVGLSRVINTIVGRPAPVPRATRRIHAENRRIAVARRWISICSRRGRAPSFVTGTRRTKGLEMKRRGHLLRKIVMTALLGLAAATFVAPGTAYAQGAIGQVKGDPTGATTGTAADVPVKDAKNPTLAEVMEVVGHNRIAINFVWTLLAGFLVMFMQAGFAMVETRFTRAKNAGHHMSMDFMSYPIRLLRYWVFGYVLHIVRD